MLKNSLGDPGSSSALEQTGFPSTPASRRKQKKKKLLDKIHIMEQIELLVHRRGQAKGKVTRMLNTIYPDGNEEIQQLSEAQIRVFIKKLEAAQKEYLTIHESILSLVSAENREGHNQHYLDFDDLHDQVAILLEEQLVAMNTATRANASLSPLNASASHQPPVLVHQPLRIPIPSFDGRYESWPKFKAMFKDLVDKTPDSPAVKLYHLDKALMGSAAGLIDAKTINEGNYVRAWEILEERYENKRHAIDTHIHALLNLKSMAKENHTELRGLMEECTRHVESLKFLEQEFTGVSELIVVHLLAASLDKETRRRWECTVKHGDLPNYNQMLEFLKEQCFILERCDSLNSKPAQNQHKPTNKSNQKTYIVTDGEGATKMKYKCDFCGKPHHNFTCSEFKTLSMQQRLAKVRERNMCFNCLRKGNRSKDCPSDRTCSKCKRHQHSLLHAEDKSKSMIEEQKVTSQSTPTDKVLVPECNSQDAVNLTSANCCNANMPTLQVLLLTAVVDIFDQDNKVHPCRILLDSASQVNLISKAMVRSLGLNQFHSNVTVAGVNNTRTHASTGSVIHIRSRYSSFEANIKCLVTENVTAELPTSTINIRQWELPPEIQLADPSFNHSGKVDLLLGNQLFLKLLLPGEVQLADNLPILRETQFGWVVGGGCDASVISETIVNSHSAILKELNQSVKRFWEVEEFEGDVKMSSEETECELHFLDTHRRDTTGRYIVELPLKECVSELGNSRFLALKRFYALERKLEQQPDLKEQYVNFMKEYEELGHCKEINENMDAGDIRKWYLPHHAVLRPSNTTTKCRVVFDASAKVDGMSLNDAMKVGGLDQNSLISIVLRFRFPRYVLTTDVAKMYRQILVDKKHSPLQRVFWRTEVTNPVRVLELTTVTYGTACAPSLATRALQQLAKDERHRFPTAANIVEEDFYVDNALFGFDTISDAIEAQSELI
ncbi:uncharacterized protein LOC131428894 [Malaya genurostris]|uniref:uncharacterized protein LOC131428894 n=1 Tax=Malaya genurostris TaxID=325434 RepID=UPI0026F406C1|nr:uncharacterized protein LOC131428894 [Malaya genurostris]